MKNFAKILVAATLLLGAASVYADDDSDLKKAQQSMTERLKTVVEYKKSGKIGENNLGYIVARVKDDKDLDAVVAADNADRKQIYDLVAKKMKSSSQQVGKQRAIIIAKNAKPGDWLQADNGKWYQKDSDADPNKKDKK